MVLGDDADGPMPPPSVRAGKRDLISWEGTFDPVGEHSVHALVQWLYGLDFFCHIGFSQTHGRHIKAGVYAAFRNHIRDPTLPKTEFELVELGATRPYAFLDIIEWALRELCRERHSYQWVSLARVLRDGGSVWTVDGQSRLLVRRLDAPEEAALENLLVRLDGEARTHLRDARQAIYGRAPNAETGRTALSKCVEAAFKPVVQKLSSAEKDVHSLGAMIGRSFPAGAAAPRVELRTNSMACDSQAEEATLASIEKTLKSFNNLTKKARHAGSQSGMDTAELAFHQAIYILHALPYLQPTLASSAPRTLGKGSSGNEADI